jgi:hypothetical protein
VPEDTDIFPDELTQILARRPEGWKILGTLKNKRVVLLYTDFVEGEAPDVGLFSRNDICAGEEVTWYCEAIRDQISYWEDASRSKAYARRNGEGTSNVTFLTICAEAFMQTGMVMDGFLQSQLIDRGDAVFAEAHHTHIHTHTRTAYVKDVYIDTHAQEQAIKPVRERTALFAKAWLECWKQR